MPIETNVEPHALYLGGIRSDGGGRPATLSRPLPRPGIDGSPERQARLLADIVHGYFVNVNYPGRAVPFERILMGFAATNRSTASWAKPITSMPAPRSSSTANATSTSPSPTMPRHDGQDTGQDKCRIRPSEAGAPPPASRAPERLGGPDAS